MFFFNSIFTCLFRCKYTTFSVCQVFLPFFFKKCFILLIVNTLQTYWLIWALKPTASPSKSHRDDVTICLPMLYLHAIAPRLKFRLQLNNRHSSQAGSSSERCASSTSPMPAMPSRRPYSFRKPRSAPCRVL